MDGKKVKGSDSGRTARVLGGAYASGGVVSTAGKVSGRFAAGGFVHGDNEQMNVGGIAGKKNLGRASGDPEGMKRGGRAKHKKSHQPKVHININTVAPNSPPDGGGMPMPPPGMPPGGGMPMGAGAPPPMPPPGPGPAPMGPMKRGGIVKMTAGAKSGLGRLQKSASAGVPTRKGANE